MTDWAEFSATLVFYVALSLLTVMSLMVAVGTLALLVVGLWRLGTEILTRSWPWQK